MRKRRRARTAGVAWRVPPPATPTRLYHAGGTARLLATPHQVFATPIGGALTVHGDNHAPPWQPATPLYARARAASRGALALSWREGGRAGFVAGRKFSNNAPSFMTTEENYHTITTAAAPLLRTGARLYIAPLPCLSNMPGRYRGQAIAEPANDA